MIDSDPIDCSKCGKPHTRCTAHKRNGDPCGHMRMVGQTICRMHGGAAKQNREKGLRVRALQEAEAAANAKIAHQPGEAVTDPVMELARLAAEVVAMKDKLAMRVNALEELRYSSDEAGVLSGYGTEQLRSEVALYERALDRSGKFLEILARLGMDERAVKLDEQRAQLVAFVLQRILSRLELTEDQQVLARQVIPGELRKLEAE